MKVSASLFLVAMAFLPEIVFCQSVPQNSRSWTAPNGQYSIVARVERTDDPLEVTFSLVRAGRTTPICESPYVMSDVGRENLGSGFLYRMEGGWVDNKYLVFKVEDGLRIVDAERSELILRNAFTVSIDNNDSSAAGYEKSPIASRWIAVRYRPMPRDGSGLEPGFQDTLVLIDPEKISKTLQAFDLQPPKVVEPLGHLVSAQAGGFVVSKPRWSEDGKIIKALVWRQGKCEISTYDGETMQEKDRHPTNIQLSYEEVDRGSFAQYSDKLFLDALAATRHSEDTISPGLSVIEKDNPKLIPKANR
ncbi:MAG: hypothetical protein JWO94_2768 [Verrucomicrobiaceae bacterium]|nr:hypothetical protein [Verrucomicrobiaceae bacterium]